jgi:hypothetical protein
LKPEIEVMDAALATLVKPFIDEQRDKLLSWHFLWENKPWPVDRAMGITLRWRFYVKEDIVNQLRELIDSRLSELERQRPDAYLGHCFGRHGECEQEYEGESENWGMKGWELGVRMLQTGSEIALELIRNSARRPRPRGRG